MKTTPPTGHFSLTIGGKERTGKLNMAGLCQIESEMGNISMMQCLADVAGKWGFRLTCTVLWVGLSNTNPQITLAHIQTWIQTAIDEGKADLADFMVASQRAVVTAMGSNVRGNVQKTSEGKLPDVDATSEGDGKDGKDGEGKDVPLDTAAKSLRSA